MLKLKAFSATGEMGDKIQAQLYLIQCKEFIRPKNLGKLAMTSEEKLVEHRPFDKEET